MQFSKEIPRALGREVKAGLRQRKDLNSCLPNLKPTISLPTILQCLPSSLTSALSLFLPLPLHICIYTCKHTHVYTYSHMLIYKYLHVHAGINQSPCVHMHTHLHEWGIYKAQHIPMYRHIQIHS